MIAISAGRRNRGSPQNSAAVQVTNTGIARSGNAGIPRRRNTNTPASRPDYRQLLTDAATSEQ